MLGKRASLLGPLWLVQCIHNPCAVDIWWTGFYSCRDLNIFATACTFLGEHPHTFKIGAHGGIRTRTTPRSQRGDFTCALSTRAKSDAHTSLRDHQVMSDQQVGVYQARPRSAACTEERLRH